jgi:hypothetical protein
MKRLLLGCSLLVFYIGITSIAPPAKTTYFSKEAKVSAVFPGQFTVSTKNEDAYSSEKAELVLDDLVYMLSFSNHKNEMIESDYDALSEVSLMAFLEGLGGKITKRDIWKVKKQKGLKSTFNVPAEGLKGEYRVVFRGQIQYQIIVLGLVDSWNQNSVDLFLNSFKLKK